MIIENGFFITLEGIEGSGKSTLSDLIYEHYNNKGYDVVRTVEPGGDEVSKTIRDLLLKSNSMIAKNTELLLFEASRAQNVANVILPALQHGKIVISDRFSDSTLAYQGYARGFSIDIVKQFNDFASQGLIPDLTILLDLPVGIGLARQIDIDRISAEKIEFHNKVRRGFLEIALQNPERIAVLDGSEKQDQVLKQAISLINISIDKKAIEV